MSINTSTSSSNLDKGLFLLRLGLGIVFVMHGWQKLFVIGHEGLTGFFGAAGIPFPAINAAIATAVELGGGLALITGLGTRLAGVLLAFTMLVAVTVVHLPNGFFLPNGYEFALSLLFANGAIALTGAGSYSLDAKLFGQATQRHSAVPAATVA
jgi:putative oxidoreductase